MTESSPTDVVTVSTDAGVAIVTLNRPDRLNSVTPAMARSYVAVLRELDDEPSVRVIVVTGAGRAFCAGADLAELSKGADHLDEHYASPLMAPDAAVHLRKPVITAINGPVAGLGFAYVLASDIRFVDPSASMQTSFAKLGLVAEYGLAWMLPRIVGTSRATELLLSSRVVNAVEAERIGLVHAISAPGAVVAEAVAYAQVLIANCSPHSWAAVKQQVLADGSRSFGESVTASYALMRESFRGHDVAEALAARAQKRAPEFDDLPRRPEVQA